MLTELSGKISDALSHLSNEYGKLSVGRANPSLVEGVSVMAYGAPGPLKNIASVSVMDPQTLAINPFDKTLLPEISKGISAANIGLNPQDNGESVLINIPPMTEERRKDIVKIAKKLAEDAKVSIRNIRADCNKNIARAKDEKTITEDEAGNFGIDLQKAIDTANKKIEEAYKIKETDIMKV